MRCEHGESNRAFATGDGLVNALLIAVPLWVILGAVLILVCQHGQVSEGTSAALMIAAICEVILVRRYARAFRLGNLRFADLYRAYTTQVTGVQRKRAAQTVFGRPGGWRRDLEMSAGRRIESMEDLLRYVDVKRVSSQRTRPAIAPKALIRQSLALSALVGAYLQYYFIDVNLQIASLHSLTVFVPVS